MSALVEPGDVQRVGAGEVGEEGVVASDVLGKACKLGG